MVEQILLIVFNVDEDKNFKIIEIMIIFTKKNI